MNTLEVLTLLLVVFAALTYIDKPLIRLIFKLIICFRLCNRWTHQNPSVSNLIINQPCGFCKRFRIEVPSAPLFCKHSIFQRPLAMPLSRLFEVLFDNPAVAKYPIF